MLNNSMTNNKLNQNGRIKKKHKIHLTVHSERVYNVKQSKSVKSFKAERCEKSK